MNVTKDAEKERVKGRDMKELDEEKRTKSREPKSSQKIMRAIIISGQR